MEGANRTAMRSLPSVKEGVFDRGGFVFGFRRLDDFALRKSIDRTGEKGGGEENHQDAMKAESCAERNPNDSESSIRG